VPWLQQQIAEQKRVDVTTSGAPIIVSDTPQVGVTAKDPSQHTDVQLFLPGDAKKTWKQKRQMFLDKGAACLSVTLLRD